MALSQSEQKTLVANTAVDTLIEKGLIFSGMKIGLGTGSTAMPAVKRLAEHINSGKLKDIKAVVTSFQTQNACQDYGIPVYSMNDTMGDNVYNTAAKHDVCQDQVWNLITDVGRRVAKQRGLA